MYSTRHARSLSNPAVLDPPIDWLDRRHAHRSCNMLDTAGPPNFTAPHSVCPVSLLGIPCLCHSSRRCHMGRGESVTKPLDARFSAGTTCILLCDYLISLSIACHISVILKSSFVKTPPVRRLLIVFTPRTPYNRILRIFAKCDN